MSSKSRFLLIAIAVFFAAAGCSSPMGIIGGSRVDDVLLTVPKRVAYDVNDLFRRNADLQVFSSCRGVVQEIPVERCGISVMEDPGYPDELSPVPPDEYYAFTSMGRKIIVVEYLNLSNQYSIEVRNPFGLGGGNSGSANGSGIVIEWLP